MALSDRRKRHDRFYQRARKQGFRARAVFKLEDIDHRVGLAIGQTGGGGDDAAPSRGRASGLIEPGARVLDLGCAPGSWLQYCRSRVGPAGRLVGIDCRELPEPVAGARVLVGDVHQVAAAELLGELDAFDVVLSDMAPNTTGVRNVDQARSEALFERALDIAEGTLAPGGRFVGKLFQGPAFADLIQRCRRRFDKVKVIKPEGSRTRSIEQYVVAWGYRGR